MWNNVVSITNGVLGQTSVRAVDVFWGHPLVGAGFLAAASALTLLLWLELLKESLARSESQDHVQSARPIRIWR